MKIAMSYRKKLRSRLLLFITTGIIIIPLILYAVQYSSRATSVKANILIDVKQSTGGIPTRWLALAQGGEEKGVAMLSNVVSEVAALFPQYIRIDHIYDYYDVVSRDNNNNLVLHWDQLDTTVCDIYRTGAKPFFSLGYMPPPLSGDGSLISVPKDWSEWQYLVQKTIERYSGQSTRLCGQVTGEWMKDIYYEVWNEPDLETFGKWSLYGGEKDYKKLYEYSVLGANEAQNVHNFFIGGPATTAAYKNWMHVFLDYISEKNLRLDFLSWHHYTKDTVDYTDDAANVSTWLSELQYQRFQSLPRIISEWGYDSEPNPIADTTIGAAHTIASIRNFSRYNISLAFLFDIKDGPVPRWGILAYDGKKKPRYHALRLLTLLEGERINVEGEGTFVRAMASTSPQKTAVILVNYDKENTNTELVPLTITHIENGMYTLTLTYLDGMTTVFNDITVTDSTLSRSVLLPPNMVLAVELALQEK